MKNNKLTGSFYTPDYLSEFIIGYVSQQFSSMVSLTVLEPSVGDGSFVKAFNKTKFPVSIKNYSFTAIDKILPELRKAESISKENKKRNTKYNFSKIDFLKYQKKVNRKFDLIVGNPPYIKKGLLNKIQTEFCKEIHSAANLPAGTDKNIWSAFLVRCTQLLSDIGVLAFVLPAELLQVKFSSQLRTYLTNQFQRVEIFTFDDLLFECKGQDTVLLIGFKQHKNPGQFYAHINDINQLKNKEFKLKSNSALVSSEIKWTHHLLSADDLNFIHNLAKKLNNVNYYCDSKPGIVSAANEFFIVDKEVEEMFQLSEYLKPIIQKGLFVNGSVVFNEKDYQNIVAEGKPAKILCFTDDDAKWLPLSVRNYLLIGVDIELPKRYKCTKRKNWFVIPNISTPSDGFFFKRSHHYPKLLKNEAKILVTDSAYKVEMKKGYHINSLIYSFYNSLTLTFAELNGRYYGGGVLELTPSEFKGLPVPNLPISAKEFTAYTKTFENKKDITEVLDANDFKILNTSLQLNSEDIQRIKGIYNKSISKRFRN